MTQTVTLEDGSIHNFPDDATPDEMTQALASVPSAPQMSSLQNFANATAKGYNQLGSGLLTLAKNVAPNATASAFGTTPEALTKAMQGARADLDTRYPTQPGISRWAGEVLGQNAPSLLVPEGLMLGGVTNALANSEPTDTLGRQAANTALSAAFSKLGGEAMNAGIQGLGSFGSKASNALSGIKSPMGEAYEAAGITPRLAGDISESPLLQQIQGTASKLPLGAGQIEDAADKTLKEFGNSVEGLASSMGKSQTLQEAGSALQGEGKKWLDNFKTGNQKLWGDLDQGMAGAQVPLSNTGGMIQSLKLQAGGNPQAEAFLKSPLIKQFQSILDAASGGSVPWNTVKALRSRVGEHLENPSLVADAGAAQAKQLYGALSGDMKTAAMFHPNAGQLMPLFNQANAYTTAGHDFIDNTLADILKKDPEKAASAILSSGVSGGSQLAAVRQNLPNAADELGAVSLRRAMAGASEGAEGNAVSPSRWLSNRDPTRRLSPEAQDALFPSKEVRSKMNALDMVAASMRNTGKYVNQSNTGGHLGTMLALSAPVEGAIAGAAAGGPHGALFGALAGGVPGALGYGTGKLSTSPALSKFLSTPSPAAPFGLAPYALSRALLPFAPQVPQ